MRILIQIPLLLDVVPAWTLSLNDSGPRRPTNSLPNREAMLENCSI